MAMETFELKEDIKIILNQAKTFPEGIKKAFDILQQSLPDCEKRTWYGLSSPNEKGLIIYKAAVTELADDEAVKFGFKPFTITKGIYISKTITDWMKNPQVIGDTFMELLEHPDIAPDGYCLEWYKNDTDVQCLVRLDQANKSLDNL